MDASTRSFFVYGKTPAGAAALKASRDGVSTAARRLLILIDGQRTLDELFGMLGRETVDLALSELESLGHIEMLRRFPEAGEELPEFDIALLDAAVAAPMEPAYFEPLADLPLVAEPVIDLAPPAPVGAALLRQDTVAPTVAAAGLAPPVTAGPVEPRAASPTASPAATARLPASAPAPPPTPAPAPAPASVRAAAAVAPAATPGNGLPVLRPKIKAVKWRSDRVASPWFIALVVVMGLLALGVWLSAREFADVAPASAQATAVMPAVQASMPAAAPAQKTSSAGSDAPVPVAAPSPRNNIAVGPNETPLAAAPSLRPAVSPVAPPPAAAAATPVHSDLAVQPAGTLALSARPTVPAASAEAAPTAVAAHRSLQVRNQVMPEIPKVVRDRGITSGHVAVILHVDIQGGVDRVELLSASPPDVYDKDMERTFGRWTFDPLGIPGRMTVEVDIRPPQ